MTWQVCPVCKGRTWMPAKFYLPDSDDAPMKCRSCDGKGVLRTADYPPRKPRDWNDEVAKTRDYFKNKDAMLQRLEIVRRRLSKLESRRTLDALVGPGLGLW